MQNYLMHLFNPERLRKEISSFNIPLKLVATQKNVVEFPKIFNGELILLFIDGTIKIFDEATLVLKWEHKIKHSLKMIPQNYFQACISGDDLLIRLDCTVYIIDLLNRKIKYQHEFKDIFLFKTALFSDNTLFYSRNHLHTLYNISEDAVIWQRSAEWDPDSSIRKDKKLIITDGYMNGDLVCLDWETGETLWKKTAYDIGNYIDFAGDECEGSIRDNPCIYGDKIIVPIECFHLAAFDIETGNELWHVKMDCESPRSYAVDSVENLIYYIGWEYLYIINIDNGNINKQISIKDEMAKFSIMIKGNGFISITENYLYILRNSPNLLMAMNKATGKIEWTYDLNDWLSYWNFPLIVNNRLYTLTNNRNLSIFEEEKGSCPG